MYVTGFSGGSLVKNLPADSGDRGDVGFIPGSGRSLGGGNGSPLKYPCLENPMDKGTCWATVHGVTELDTTEQLRKHTDQSYAFFSEMSLQLFAHF